MIDPRTVQRRRAGRRAPAPIRPVLTLLVAGLVAGCTSASSSAPSTTVTSSLPASTTEPTPSTVPPSTSAGATSTSTSLPVDDPTFDDLQDGRCTGLVPGAISYRNETANRADEYRPIGTSEEGRTIWAEHWGAREGTQVLVLGQVHGDECTPAFMVRAIRERPPTSFGIWLVPTVNPDGLAEHTRWTADGTDPNRDGFDLATPEARAVMDVTAGVQPALTIHLHSPYGWVGAHNGPLALEVATAVSEAAGWGRPFNAGRVENGTLAFLWEGQERVIPGHQSVLVEFPGLSDDEAPDAPKPEQRKTATVADVDAAAVAMRDALYAVFELSASG